MVLKKEYTSKELLPLVKDFENRYNDVLDNIDISFLEDCCTSGIFFDIVPYLLTQFYVEYNLINNDHNIYIGVLNKLKEVMNLKKKSILEVGGGPIPTLARMISKETEKEVTVMDSNITIKNNNISNLNIYKRIFLPYTSIDEYDLIIAFMACGTSEFILRNCGNNNKDFFIGLCPCGKEGINYILETNLTNQRYIDGIIKYADKIVKECNMGELVIDRLDQQYSYPFPIIYNKRPKMITYKKR